MKNYLIAIIAMLCLLLALASCATPPPQIISTTAQGITSETQSMQTPSSITSREVINKAVDDFARGLITMNEVTKVFLEQPHNMYGLESYLYKIDDAYWSFQFSELDDNGLITWAVSNYPDKYSITAW